MLSKRMGVFSINTNGGENFDNEQIRKEISEIMKLIIVVKAVHMPSMDQINYVAMCEQFDELGEGDVIPQYQPMLVVGDSKELEVYFERIENYINTTEALQ